ncbi:MAG: hypothetical protein QXG00_04195 [Candidatus Woesearchaeota archaeon]
MKKDLIKIELSIIYSIILFLLLTVNLFSQTISHRASSKYIIINSNGADTVWVKNVARDSANRAEINAKSYTDSRLAANPYGWRNSAQAKQDAIDTTAYPLTSLNEQITNLSNTVNAALTNIYQRLDTIEARLNVPTIPTVYPPTNVVATGGLRQVNLSWTRPTAGTYDSLHLYWSYSLSSNFTMLVKLDTAATSYTHTGLLNNTRYYYYLISYKGTAYSSPSIIVNALTDSVISEPFAILADAETNNLSQFSSTVADTATSIIATRDSAKLHGNYGFLMQDNGYNLDNVYGRINFTAKDSVYTRAYIKIPSTFKSINTPNYFTIFGIYFGNTVRTVLQVARTTDIYTHKLAVQNAAGALVDILNPLPKDSVICFELFYKKGTGTDAITRLYINNVLAYEHTTGTATGTVDNVRVGIVSFGSRVDVGSYMFYDDIVVNDSYIGLYGGSSSSGGGGTIAGNKIYLAPNSLGNGSGADSSNAMSINSFSFNSASPGDTIILTQGNYSLTSTITITADGTSSQPITVMSSYPYGATISGSTIFDISAEYWKFKFIKFQNFYRAFDINAGSNVIYIDSCYFTKFSSQGGIVNAGGNSGTTTSIDSIFIRYNYALNDTQTYSQADMIYTQYAGNIFIIKNYLENKDTIDVSQHIDCIQTANMMGTVVIVGNKIVNYKKESSQGMMLNISAVGEQILYNNSVYVPSNAKPISSYWLSGTSAAKVYYLNNTVYNKSAVSGWVGITFEMYGRQGVVSYNNIAYNDGTPTTTNIFSAAYYDYPVGWGDSINNNLYWTNYCPSPQGSPGAGNYYSITAYNINTATSSIWSLAQWQASTNNPDRNSLQANPLFKDKLTGDLRLSIGSPAIGAGKDISSLISYLNLKYPNCGFEWRDINGTLRNSTPNMGAYEGAY